MTRITMLFVLGVLLTLTSYGQPDFYQNYEFSRADSLRGMLRAERTCYDVQFYELDIRIDPDKKHLIGHVSTQFKALKDFERLQIDLFSNMQIDSIIYRGQPLSFEREYDAVFIRFPLVAKGKIERFTVYYQGSPQIAENAPWDGGFVWKKDQNKKHWVGVACEGDGASLWWPNKDHLSDEPDSVRVILEVPGDLYAVSNGRLKGTQMLDDGFTRYEWFVSNPINNYNVTVNIGDYVHFSDTYTAADGDKLDLNYYVLRNNLAIAQKHFKQVQPMLACFENYFGKYPFWEDSYALVETPYLGMEHQSAIAYGNQYTRGYLGGMIPRDMDWDYIIIHETGHEYFGNAVSAADLSDMWIHESFTTYMEALYVECRYSYDDAVRYLRSQRNLIANKEPILGPPNVNWENWRFSDHYYKGAWMLHSLRHAINDDELWFDMLRALYEHFRYTTTDTQAIIDFVNRYTGRDWTAFFKQYLWYPELPVFEYKLQSKRNYLQLSYRWKTPVENFDMPMRVGKPGNYQVIEPTHDKWQNVRIENCSVKDFKIATELFLIETALAD